MNILQTIGMIRGLAWGFFGAIVFCVIAAIALWPEPEKPDNFAIGRGLITIETFQKQLDEVSTRRGLEKVTRKEVKPVSQSIAPGGTTSIVERFVAAAVDTGSVLADSSATGAVVSIPAQPDTVCLGVGGSIRRGSLTILSACAPGGDGLADEFRGRNFDWSYAGGRLNVTASRGPDWRRWLERAAIAGLAGYAGSRLF